MATHRALEPGEISRRRTLKRLRTDWLDFYFVHAFDVRTPIEQNVCTPDDFQQRGKILYPAVSNWAAWHRDPR